MSLVLVKHPSSCHQSPAAIIGHRSPTRVFIGHSGPNQVYVNHRTPTSLYRPWGVQSNSSLTVGSLSKCTLKKYKKNICHCNATTNKKNGYRQQNVRQRQKLISIIDYDVCILEYLQPFWRFSTSKNGLTSKSGYGVLQGH